VVPRDADSSTEWLRCPAGNAVICCWMCVINAEEPKGLACMCHSLSFALSASINT
jgi:hypothetical protein